jgi:hypothetical protein
LFSVLDFSLSRVSEAGQTIGLQSVKAFGVPITHGIFVRLGEPLVLVQFFELGFARRCSPR